MHFGAHQVGHQSHPEKFHPLSTPAAHRPSLRLAVSRPVPASPRSRLANDLLTIGGIVSVVAAVSTAPEKMLQATRLRSASDRKSTRLNSSHVEISYAVFCL